MRAAELVIKLERLIMGEPSERSEVSVEEVTKRELARWLVVKKDDADGGQDEASAAPGTSRAQ